MKRTFMPLPLQYTIVHLLLALTHARMYVRTTARQQQYLTHIFLLRYVDLGKIFIRLNSILDRARFSFVLTKQHPPIKMQIDL